MKGFGTIIIVANPGVSGFHIVGIEGLGPGH